MSRASLANKLPIISMDEVKRAWARRSYLRYCQLVHNGNWIPAKHHRLICEKLDAVARGEIQRLMVWMPPQHGKSMSITETFPSYFLGKYPDRRVIEVSYNDTFAKKFGRKNREKIDLYGNGLWEVTLSQVNFSASNWSLAGSSGGMISVGVGGAATGEGADLLLIDDPVKNREEANSKTHRDKLWDEYQSTFKSRLHPGGAIIIVMTRWHEDDLCGRLLNPEYGDVEDWEILKLSAVCEDENDLLGRKIGEALWPEYGYDEVWLEAQKGSIGSYAFAGLYQQRPAPQEGGLFKRSKFRFYKELPANLNHAIQSWDCTFKEAEKNDFVAGQVWGMKGSRFYLLDRIHERMGIAETMQGIRMLDAKWPKARAKVVEDKANGSAVIELLSKEIPGMIPVNPNGGKVARAQAILPYLEAENIYLPDPSIAPWVKDFIEECVSFPNALHDDDVDAMTQAITQLMLLFGNGGGMIYRAFSDEPEAYMLPRTVLQKKLLKVEDEKVHPLAASVCIGISSGNTAFGTSFVATAMSQSYESVYVVAAHVCGGNDSPEEIARAFSLFSEKVVGLCGRRADYVYLDSSDTTLHRTIKLINTHIHGLRSAIDLPEPDRISLTLSLLSERRIVFSEEDAAELSDAMMVAQWKHNSGKTKRDDDSAANTVLIQAFERSIEKYRKYLIKQ